MIIDSDEILLSQMPDKDLRVETLYLKQYISLEQSHISVSRHFVCFVRIYLIFVQHLPSGLWDVSTPF